MIRLTDLSKRWREQTSVALRAEADCAADVRLAEVYEELADELDEAVRCTPELMPWVSVLELLPDASDLVLVYGSGEVGTAYFDTSMSRGVSRGWVHCTIRADVTHWRPLSKGPQP